MHHGVANSHICEIDARTHCAEYYVESKLYTRKQINKCIFGYYYQKPEWCPKL